MGRSRVNPSYAFVKFKLEHKRVNSIKEILKDLDIPILGKDLGLSLSEMDSLIKNPSNFRFETGS
jgi:chemotaxis receptor (MCP) glutamine deamidase CheD